MADPTPTILDRLHNSDVKLWAQYYARLIAVNVWNSFLLWGRVTFGAALISSTGLIDLSKIGWKGAGATLLGTILARAFEAMFRSQLPEPAKPIAK